MPTIRYRYHYGCTYLTTGGLATPTTALIGSGVRVRRNGEWCILPFRGFTREKRVSEGFETVAFENLMAISSDKGVWGHWIDLPKQSYLAVIYLEQIYLVLNDEGYPLPFEG